MLATKITLSGAQKCVNKWIIRDQTPYPSNVNRSPVRKLVYFRELFVTFQNYRANYVDETMYQKIQIDKYICSRITERQKLVTQATFCWNELKNNQPEKMSMLKGEYWMDMCLNNIPELISLAGRPATNLESNLADVARDELHYKYAFVIWIIQQIIHQDVVSLVFIFYFNIKHKKS